MSVVASVPPRLPFPTRPGLPRHAGRVGLLIALVAALVAGLMSGVAHAADTGGFTPIDFSQAPPPPPPSSTTQLPPVVINGSVTFGGDLSLTPPELDDQFVTVLTYSTPGKPALGEAHLFSRTSGLAPMSEAQYAGMVALEGDAVRTVMQARGVTPTAYNHDLVIRYAREDVTVTLFARLQQALAKDTPIRTPDEQSALTWLVAVAQAHARGATQEAQHQYALWKQNPCTFRAPAPYTDYEGNLAPYCQGYRSFGALPPQDKVPSKEQFLAWGAAAYDATSSGGKTNVQGLFTASVSEAAIAFGAAGAFFGVAATAGLAAQFLTAGAYGAGALTTAVFPYFGLGVKTAADLLSRAVTTGTELSVTAAQTTATNALSATSRLASILQFSTVLGPVLVIAGAIVTAVLAGIDAFAARNTESALDAAAANASSDQPDLRTLLGTTGGQQQVFGDLTASVIDCSSEKFLAPGECNIDAEQPTRRADDPVFTTTDVATGRVDGPAKVSVPITLGKPDAWVDTTLTVRDGWFTFADRSEPTQLFRYTDDRGQARTAHLLSRNGRYFFQSLLEPTDPSNPAGSGYAPGVDCTTGSVTQPCFTSTSIPMRTSSGRNVYVDMNVDHAPTAPVIATNRPAAVGVPVQLSATLPPNTVADPDGDAVTGTWTVEFDQPCATIDPAIDRWNCSDGSTGTGPHGGFPLPLTRGPDTVVWNTAGTYRVTRTVTDPFGVGVSTSMDVVVAPAPRILFAACLQCDPFGGKQVQIAGRIGFGAHRDGETVTIDWGDGTTTSGVPSQSSYGHQFLSPTFWARIENSSQYQFQAVHTYAAGTAGNRITVSATDAGDGNPPPVTLAADTTGPVVDPTSYEDIVSDRLVDLPIPVRLPVFTDSQGNHPTPVCTAPDGYGGPDRTVTDFTAFRTGTTFTVTCTGTAPSGLAKTVTFTVETHQVTAHLVATPATVVVGQPVTYTATGTTDDGRDVGDVTDRITVQSEAAGVECSVRTCSRTTTAGPITASPMADDNHVGDPVSTPVTSGVAGDLTVTSAVSQTVPVNTALPNGFSFVVRDGYGNPVPNTPVTLSVASGSGVLAGGVTTLQVQTDALGAVVFGGSVGGTPGPVVFQATVTDDVVAQFTATVVAGDGLRGASGNGQRVRVGATPAPLVTQVVDGSQTPVAGQPVTVRLGRGPARFASGGSTATGTTDANGLFSVPLAPATGPGTTIFTVTSGDDTAVLATYYVANAAPVAGPATYSVTAGAGGLRTAAGNGVLNGVVDADGDALTAALVTKAGHGTLKLARDGSFTYVPQAGFVGTDTFTFTAGDGLLTAAPQVATIQVAPASADLAVVMSGPATLARGKAAALGVYVTNRGPSAAGTVSVSVTLPAGLTFGKVPDGVAVSANRRTATSLVSALGNGATKRWNLQVLVAADAGVGKRTVQAAAGTALVADPVAPNNTFGARLAVT